MSADPKPEPTTEAREAARKFSRSYAYTPDQSLETKIQGQNIELAFVTGWEQALARNYQVATADTKPVPLADDAELINRLRLGYGSKIKLEVADFVALDALAMEAGGRLSQRSAALRAVRELCDKRAHERRSEFAKLTVAELRRAMENAKAQATTRVLDADGLIETISPDGIMSDTTITERFSQTPGGSKE